MWRAYPFAADEVACQRSPTSFSVSPWETLGALLRGVPTAIVPETIGGDIPALGNFVARHRVTRILMIPSLLRVILAAPLDVSTRFEGLRLWSVCGEPLPTELLGRFRERFPAARLLNQYGATELTDVAWGDT